MADEKDTTSVKLPGQVNRQSQQWEASEGSTIGRELRDKINLRRNTLRDDLRKIGTMGNLNQKRVSLAGRRVSVAAEGRRTSRISPMIVPSRDPYYARTLDMESEDEGSSLMQIPDEPDEDSHDDCHREERVDAFEEFIYERQRERHEWNKRGSIIEEIVCEREQAALDSLRKYGRVFGRWQNDARRTYYLPSYIRAKAREQHKEEENKYYRWGSHKIKFLNKKKNHWQDLYLHMHFWTQSFHTIEGYFGAGVVAYFVFLKWLFVLNLWICSITFGFVVFPQIAFTEETEYDYSLVGNITQERLALSKVCSDGYVVKVVKEDSFQLFLDLLQGTGWMEKTVMFYGAYSNKKLIMPGDTGSFSMPLAYLVVVMAFTLVSLVMMVRHTALGIKARIIEAEDKYFLYGNMGFGSWDYSLTDPHSGVLKHRSILNEIRGELAEQRRKRARKLQDQATKLKLLARRIGINFFVIACLCIAGYLIYYATTTSTQFIQQEAYKEQPQVVKLLIQFVPSLTITSLNFIIPFVFSQVVKGEDFSKDTEDQITLGRTVFLRLASLAVLIFTMYTQITCEPKNRCGVGLDPCPSIKCWETYIGQQLYKLIIVDFFTVLFSVAFVQFPRGIFVKKWDNKLARTIGKPEFHIPKNVLDIVYSQALCWLGTFFSPVIPFICVVKFFCFFYLKKVTCIYNHEPAAKPYRASKSHAFFMLILLSTFILICIPIGYIIWLMTPSRTCGPFRAYNYMYDIVGYTLNALPPIFSSISAFLLSPGFIGPLVVFLCVLTYYFAEISSANNVRTAILKEQLILEGRDKQYLLSRIDRLTHTGQRRQGTLVRR